MSKMIKRMMAMVSLGVFCAAMCPMIPANAEEPIVKNFEYYQSLSDYEVYVEYCETYGFEAEETMPIECLMPHYDYFQLNVVGLMQGCPYNEYVISCPKNLVNIFKHGEIGGTAEVFGFPEEWGYITTPESVCGNLGEYDGITYVEILVNIGIESHLETYGEDIADSYRVALTLNHSEFAAQYGCPGFLTQRAGLLGQTPHVGDANSDKWVDARDAAKVLEYASLMGAGNDNAAEIVGINPYLFEVTGDDVVNAKDAAMILRYSAAEGVGSAQIFEIYLYEQSKKEESYE